MCNCIDTKTFNYKGEVTSINFDLCQFTLDEQYKVYAGYVKKFKMPLLNEEIVISKAIFVTEECIFLLDNSLISCLEYSDSELSKKSNKFIKIYLNKLKFGINDILLVEKTYEKFKKAFTDCFINSKLKLAENITGYDILLKAFVYLRKKDRSSQFCLCRHMLANNLDHKYPYLFQIVEINAKPIAKKVGYSFTCQKNKSNEILIGFLTYNTDFKYLMLSDEKFDSLCVIGCEHSTDIKRYINKFILLKNYIFVTEMCKETNANEITYFYFHIGNIQLLDVDLNKLEIPFRNPNLETYYCNVIHRGTYCFNIQNNTTECWIHLKILLKKPFECLLTSTRIFNIYPFIDSGTQLILRLPKSEDVQAMLNKYRVRNNIELNRIFTIPAFVLPPQFPIEIEQSTTPKNKRAHVLTFEEALATMGQRNIAPISFIAIIDNKIIKRPLYSRTAGGNFPIPKSFGTPGTMTHVLTVHGFEDKNKKATIYLNNWEAIQSPLGLLVGMKIIIGYIIPQKTYFKSCLLTSFQPLEMVHLPKISTCYEYTNNINWGPFAMLSEGAKLPEGAVCWCPIYRAKLRRLKIRSKCANCKRNGLFLQKTCCNDDKFIINMNATFVVQDYSSRSLVNVNSIDIFLTILKIDKKERETFMNTLADLRVYDYSAQDIRIREKTKVTFYAGPVSSIMECLVIFFDSQLGMETNIDLKCIHTKFNTTCWLAIEARSREEQ